MKDVPQPNGIQTKNWARCFRHPGGGRCNEAETCWKLECKVSVSSRGLNNLDWRKVPRLRMEVISKG